MSGTGQADWAMMTQIADKVEGQIANEIDSTLRMLQDSLSQLAPQWKSDAANAFYGVNTQWQDDTTQVNQALKTIADGIRATAAAYQRMTEESQDTVPRITS